MTKRAELEAMSVDELVDRFMTLAVAQDKALLVDDISEANRLFDKLEATKAELRRRPGDRRKDLLKLYDHPNPQVRIKAVKATLAVAPKRARHMLRIIADSKEFPQAGEAGMSIRNLKRGIFKPT